MRLGSTGVGVFRSPFYHLQRQTYRGGLSIYRKFRVKISTRSAYLFGLRLSGVITFSHCCLLSFCSLPGVYPVGSFSAFRPGVFLLWNRGTSCRKIPPLLAPPLGRRTPPASYAPGKIPRTGQLSQSSFHTTSPGLSASLNPCQLSLRADASAKSSVTSTATFVNM